MTEKEFILRWIEKIKEELKIFPDDFLDKQNLEELELPGKNLLIAPPLFNIYEIIDAEGNIHFSTDDFIKAKFIVYSNRNKPLRIPIPSNSTQLKDTVKKYENYIDGLLKEIEKEFKRNFPASKNFAFVSNQIFNSLNLIRL